MVQSPRHPKSPMNAVLAVAFPVFAVIATGLFAGARGILPASDVAAINRFVFKVAMPGGVFGVVAAADPIGGDAAKAMSVYAVAAAITLVTGYLIGLRIFNLRPPEAGAHAFASTLGSAVFLGLPVAIAIEGWAAPFISLMLIEGLVVLTIGAALMDGSPDKKVADYLMVPFKNPLVAATIAGLVVSMSRAVAASAGAPFDLPAPVATVFLLLGRAAGPAALISLGLFIATTPRPPIDEVGGRIFSILVVKMLLLPLMMFAGISIYDIGDPAIEGAAMLFSVVPTGVGTFVMANQYGVYSRETAAAIAVTTIVSIVSITAVLAIYAG
ncbi:MAG: AEC family transporter [Pseudomonadota bacterium]